MSTTKIETARDWFLSVTLLPALALLLL